MSISTLPQVLLQLARKPGLNDAELNSFFRGCTMNALSEDANVA